MITSAIYENTKIKLISQQIFMKNYSKTFLQFLI